MVMLPVGGDPDPLQLYVNVTTTCVAVAFTLKLYDDGGMTIKVTVAVCVIEGLVHVAVTTMLNVPLVVINVGTESVAVLGNELIEVGLTVEVTPGGLPDVTLRLTVPVNPPKAARLSVKVALTPAPTLCEPGEAVIEKSTPVV